ncbi:MAG: S41 family peptidase [Cyclobacteriaceae bacterium]
MKRKIKVASIFLSIGLVTLFAFSSPAEKYFDIAKSLDIFATLFKEVNTYYVDDVDPKKLVETGIVGMLEQLDPYTDYIPEESKEAFSILTTGQYAGVGALIGIVNKKTVITNPYFGFPAYRAGLKVGDEFMEVDGKDVQGKPTSEVSALLKGNPKTEVEVAVKRYGQKENIKVKLMREKIKITNIVYEGLIDTEIGYIRLDEFTPGAGKEVIEAVENLKRMGAKKLVLDLRNNPGGSLYEAVNIVNAFIPKGKEVVSTKGKVQDWNKTYTTLNNPIDTEIPLAILTSGGSASAAEIVAGSLQDYDRAVLVGQKTFGKGLVQTTRQLAYNAQLKVTTAKYYIPSGRCIQALDYTHRKSDGSVEKFADSVKREFKTTSGRKVYDGAGLDPDLPVKNDEYSSALVELVNAGYVFEYASKYCGENSTPPASLKNFRLSEVEYKKFTDWIKSRQFSYSTELEKKANELITSAKNEKYYDDLKVSLIELQNKISQFRSSDLARLRPEISSILEEEIGFHYQLIAGQVEVSLARDPEILEAKKILTDLSAYKKILSPN